MIYYSIDEICEKVHQLIRTFGTDDPEELCDMLEIVVTEEDFGKSEDTLRGMVTLIPTFKMTCIVLNSNLSEITRIFYLAHELGHSVLHISEDIKRISDIGLLDNTDTMEIEANLFAAELLLGDSDNLVKEIKDSELTAFQFAASKNVPYELFAYKVMIMREQGYKVREIPIMPDSRFLSKVKGVFD